MRMRCVVFALFALFTLGSPATVEPTLAQGFGEGIGQSRREHRERVGYQDPAFARGYAEGHKRGLADGRRASRYDPVRHRDYRDADDGYYRRYGSRQAYENNYRAGFRQGYERGYREGGRSGRRF